MTNRPQNQKTVLIADDDPLYAPHVHKIYAKAGYQVFLLSDLAKIREITASLSVDLIMVNIDMRAQDGVAVCRELRQIVAAPIIALSAGELTNRQLDFLINEADDYLAKPFSASELLTRTQLLLRNRWGKRWHRNVIAVGDLFLDKVANIVIIGDTVINLTPNESQLLSYMMLKPGETLRKEEIIQAVWHSRFYDDSNTLRVTVRRLRHKIERNPSNPGYLLTVYGVGYKLRTAIRYLA